MAEQLWFVKMYLNKPQNFKNTVFWKDKTRVNIFGHNAQHCLVKTKHSILVRKCQSTCHAQRQRGDESHLLCSH